LPLCSFATFEDLRDQFLASLARSVSVLFREDSAMTPVRATELFHLPCPFAANAANCRKANTNLGNSSPATPIAFHAAENISLPLFRIRKDWLF
jgi:hypothetical protein